MPCYEQRRVTVNLNGADRDLLAQAISPLLIAAGLVYWGHASVSEEERARLTRQWVDRVYDGKRIQLSAELDPNAVKRAYSERVLAEATRLGGWRVQQRGVNQYVAQRRA